MMNAGATHQVDKIGVFTPKQTEVAELGPGEIGYITAQIKQVADAAVGDTITEEKRQTEKALAGFRVAQSVVF